VSDISISFTWWQIVLGVLGLAFLPLTIAVFAAAVWVWRQRSSKLAWGIAIVVAGVWLISCGTNIVALVYKARAQGQYLSDLRARQRTLTTEMTVAGMRLPARTVVTYGADTSDVVALDLPVATKIHGLPISGHVGLVNDALHGEAQLAQDTRIGAVPCSARVPVRFELGTLAECRLSQPSRVHGIPCAGTVTLENGVVCTLASDYARFSFVWRAQTKVTDYGDLVWFRIGGNAPSLLVLGTPLGSDTEVQFQHGRIASVDLRSAPARFRGCKIQLILVSGGKTTGRAVDACNIPGTYPGSDVALPSTTFSRHPILRG
jgi:hypothetical protein